MSYRRRRTGFIFIAVLAALLLPTGITQARKTVVVAADGQEMQVITYGRDVAAVLRRQSITLGEGDIVTPDLNTRVTEGMHIAVLRAIPAWVSAGGITREIRTVQPTVGAALQEAGVALGVLDRCDPTLATAVVPGMIIKVIRVAEIMKIVQEVVPFPVESKNDSSLGYGITKVLQEGCPGLAEVIYRKVFEDNAEKESKVIARTVVKAAVPKVVAVGTMRTVSRGGETFRYKRVLEVTATAYYPDPAWSDGYTYLGLPAAKGIIAVDPKVIPLRSKVYVEGYGFAVAGDTGGAIKGHKIDVCFATGAEVDRWGVRKVKVYIDIE